MKGMLKTVTALAPVGMLGACSSFNSGPQVVAEYKEPNWVTKCKQEGTEGGFLFWGGTEMIYSCGHGSSPSRTLAFKSAKSLAYDGIAERINGYVDSTTKISASDKGGETKSTVIKYVVNKTTINNQVVDEKYTQILNGKFHVFVRIKLEKSSFEELKTLALRVD